MEEGKIEHFLVRSEDSTVIALLRYPFFRRDRHRKSLE